MKGVEVEIAPGAMVLAMIFFIPVACVGIGSADGINTP